jgi:hypothetical protein
MKRWEERAESASYQIPPHYTTQSILIRFNFSWPSIPPFSKYLESATGGKIIEETSDYLGDDADTTGANCGQLTGVYCGVAGIPPSLRSGSARMDMLEKALDAIMANTDGPYPCHPATIVCIWHCCEASEAISPTKKFAKTGASFLL